MDQPAQKQSSSDQSIQNQQASQRDESVPASQPQPTNFSANLKSKFPTFSSRPKVAILAAAISAILLICILASFIVLQQVSKRRTVPIPSPTPDLSKLPSENLSSTNGQIVGIDSNNKKVSIKSSSPRSDGSYITWTVIITKDTILAKAEDWGKAGTVSADSTIPIEGRLIDYGSTPTIPFNQVKVGDKVYLMAKDGQDLATMDEIEGPTALLLE